MAERFPIKEQDQEIEQIKQRLQAAGKHTALPDSLRGENLLHLLEDVNQDPVKEPSGEKKGKTYFLSWQALVTYAALFVILFGLAWGVVDYRKTIAPPVATGGPTIVLNDDQRSVASPEEPDKEPQTFSVDPEGLYDSPTAEDSGLTGGPGVEETPQEETPVPHSSPASPSTGEENVLSSEKPKDTPAVEAPASSAKPEGAAEDASQEKQPKVAASRAFGIGGGSLSHPIGEWNGKALAWRTNDPSDPEKKDITVTIEVLNPETQSVEQQLGLTAVKNITRSAVWENYVAVAGDTLNNSYTMIYQSDDGGTLSPYVEMNIPGRLYTYNIHNGVLYLASRGNSLADGWNSAVLRDSTESGITYLAAINLRSGDATTLALQGLAGEVVLEQGEFFASYRDSSGEIRTASVAYEQGALLLTDDWKSEQTDQ